MDRIYIICYNCLHVINSSMHGAVASASTMECSLYRGPGKSCHQIAGEALSYCLTCCQCQVMQLHSEQRRQVAQDISWGKLGTKNPPPRCVCLVLLFHLTLLALLRVHLGVYRITMLYRRMSVYIRGDNLPPSLYTVCMSPERLNEMYFNQVLLYNTIYYPFMVSSRV